MNPADCYHVGVVVDDIAAAGDMLSTFDRALFGDWPGFLKSMAA